MKKGVYIRQYEGLFAPIKKPSFVQTLGYEKYKAKEKFFENYWQACFHFCAGGQLHSEQHHWFL
jgi:hypothetical protein